MQLQADLSDLVGVNLCFTMTRESLAADSFFWPWSSFGAANTSAVRSASILRGKLYFAVLLYVP